MFRILGDDHYTCVAPAGYEKDPAVTAAIREFDPGMVPIWRVQTWLFPGEFAPRNVVHHGIARYYPIPRYVRRPLSVAMPADADGPAPNFLDAMFEETQTLSYKGGGPGGYIPWDWAVHSWCRKQYERITVAMFDALVQGRKDWLEKAHEDWKKELDYRRNQIEPWILKRLENVSDADWEAYLELVGGGEATRAARVELRRRNENYRVKVAVGGSRRSPRKEKTYGRVAPGQGA